MKRNQTLYQSKLSLLIERHKKAIALSLERLKKHKANTLLTCLVIAITFALPLMLSVIVKNADLATKGLTDSSKISIYFKVGTSEQAIQNVITQLSSQDSIIDVKYISPQQGLNDFAKSVGFEHLLSGLDSNPLPAVLEVMPSLSYQSPEKMSVLASQLKQYPNVAEVQLDMAWVKRLFAIINLIKKVTLGIALILGFGIIVIVGNTIKFAIQKHAQEIMVFKLIGASDAMIQRPFLYTGIFYGLFGVILALIIVAIFALSLSSIIQRLAESFSSSFHLHLFSFSGFIAICLIGMFLGLSGAWFIVRQNIRKMSY